MFAVTVQITLHPGQAEAFPPLMQANARASLLEPACHQFDICTDPARPEEVFLYELYTDAAGFDAHLQTAHFKSFDAQTAGMIASKSAQTFAQVTQ